MYKSSFWLSENIQWLLYKNQLVTKQKKNTILYFTLPVSFIGHRSLHKLQALFLGHFSYFEEMKEGL
jgi:hypothetical protein